MNEYLQLVANNFDLTHIFQARRQRELPIRNYLQVLLEENNITTNREVRVYRNQNVNSYRSIDLVNGIDYYQLAHYTLAQYGNMATPITQKILTEQNVFSSITVNLPPIHNQFLIYITTDIIDCPIINQREVEQFPLLRYYKNVDFHQTRDTKLRARNAELNDLLNRQDIRHLESFERAIPILIGNRFNAKLYIDFFQLN